MLNQMKVKKLRLNYHRQVNDNCFHHQLTLNVCLIICDTIKTDLVLWYGVNFLVKKHSRTPVHSPWKVCLVNKLFELHALHNLLISFSFIEIQGFSASTSSESLGNFNEFLVILFLERLLEETTNLV